MCSPKKKSLCVRFVGDVTRRKQICPLEAFLSTFSSVSSTSRLISSRGRKSVVCLNLTDFPQGTSDCLSAVLATHADSYTPSLSLCLSELTEIPLRSLYMQHWARSSQQYSTPTLSQPVAESLALSHADRSLHTFSMRPEMRHFSSFLWSQTHKSNFPPCAMWEQDKRQFRSPNSLRNPIPQYLVTMTTLDLKPHTSPSNFLIVPVSEPPSVALQSSCSALSPDVRPSTAGFGMTLGFRLNVTRSQIDSGAVPARGWKC